MNNMLLMTEKNKCKNKTCNQKIKEWMKIQMAQ